MLADVLVRWGALEESPLDLYSDVFRLGEGLIQREGEPSGLFKANPLIIGHSGGADGRMHRKIMFEDTFADTLSEFQDMDWAYMSGCTYFGRQNSSERQSKLCALIFDIDGVTDSTLNNFLSGALDGGAYPVPQHVVLSGHGVHLYYVFEEPLDLFPNIKTQVKELKFALTRQMWNMYTSVDENIQYQGINQAFRVPGSKTKDGAPIDRCIAYRLSAIPTTIEELNSFVDDPYRVELGKRYRETRMTAQEAREKHPGWYERVVVGGQRGQWVVKRDLYEWWLRKISTGATYGHRYFCVMILAIYAAKCGIYDEEKVRSDAVTLIPRFNALNPEKPFTEVDIESALDCLDGRYTRFPRSEVEKLSAIPVPPNKRNGRRREQHMAVMRAIQNVTDPDGDWRNKNGAPKKRDMIREYAALHPEASQREIASALGVSKTTVNKWLKEDKGGLL